MTKFTTLKAEIKKEKKETEFTHVTVFNNIKQGVYRTMSNPYEWDNVMYIGYTPEYGDVFKAWSNMQDSFVIYFGAKGDEFD
jgi:hypothetical protein